MVEGPFVFFSPVLCIVNFNFMNQLINSTKNRNRNPLYTPGGFYFITISPVPVSILDILKKNKNIDIMNDVKISFPRKII